MTASRRLLAGLSVATVGGLLVALAVPAQAVPATAPPIAANPASVVRSTALPTAQIDGTAYAQVIVGDTVYVGGDFTAARPAGVALGGAGTVTRSNLMAYSLSTGQIVGNFSFDVNNTVRALAASPDGTRLYVGGLFTEIDTTPRYRIASIDLTTNSLVKTFQPTPNYVVQTIAATATTVYFGGKFSVVNGVDRSNLAAVKVDTGRLLAWAPVADSTVQAMVLAPNKKKVFVGGNFANLNGTAARGLGALTVNTGATLAFAANQVVYSYGTKAAILTLTTDGKAIYGTSYNYGGTGNLEGAFSANPSTGKIIWVEDCHGDTYSAYSDGATVYTVGHAHYCGNIGGFPQVSSAGAAHRAIAFTAAAEGTVQTNQQSGYANLAGQPAPSLRQWFPDVASGADRGNGGTDQAAWSVTGNGTYVVMAGEFPTVNGVAQEGLVRFATAPTSPDTMGPEVTGAKWTATVTANGATGATISFPSNWDRDDLYLNYRVTRDKGSGTAAANIWTGRTAAEEWSRPTITVNTTNLKPGTTYRFRVYATDPAGNGTATSFVSYTAPSS